MSGFNIQNSWSIDEIPGNVITMDEASLKVYPNPAVNKLYMDNLNGINRIIITNIAGLQAVKIQYVIGFF